MICMASLPPVSFETSFVYIASHAHARMSAKPELGYRIWTLISGLKGMLEMAGMESWGTLVPTNYPFLLSVSLALSIAYIVLDLVRR